MLHHKKLSSVSVQTAGNITLLLYNYLYRLEDEFTGLLHSFHVINCYIYKIPGRMNVIPKYPAVLATGDLD